MARTFTYKAKNKGGQFLHGKIIADNPAAVATYIRNQGYYTLQITESGNVSWLTTLQKWISRVNSKDLAVFCQLFATMTGAGLSLIKCLGVLAEQTQQPQLKDALTDMYKKIREGESLSGMMARHPDVFPVIMLGMIEAGEAGGVLDKILVRLAELFRKEYKMSEKIKSAMIYPVSVMILAMLAVLFILMFILPSFAKILACNEAAMPVATQLLMEMSRIMQVYWWLFLGLFTLALIPFGYLYKNPKTRLVLGQAIYYTPVFGELMKKITVARFSYTLGILLKSSMPMLTALEMVKKIVNTPGMMQIVTVAQFSIRNGENLSSVLMSSKIFSPMVIQMIRVGEETGELDEMLEKIADFYESEADEMVSRLSALLEPFLIVFLGVVIGGVVLSVLLPMIDTITNIGN